MSRPALEVTVAAIGAVERELVSYLTLRRIVGVLGVALPVVLALLGFAFSGRIEILPSVSDYYSLRSRDVLVGVLCTIGWFLFVYRGYQRKDSVAGNLGCLLALGVAFFPNSGTPLEKGVHYGCALGLFLVLSYFSLFLFTKSGDFPTPRKKVRNRVYRTCGVSMLVCIALIGVYNLLHMQGPGVFVLETLMLWAFGFSWFVKGETLWKDVAA
jgi:hypothetical protein